MRSRVNEDFQHESNRVPSKFPLITSRKIYVLSGPIRSRDETRSVSSHADVSYYLNTIEPRISLSNLH